jgi:lipoyl(octanoyl) transferase
MDVLPSLITLPEARLRRAAEPAIEWHVSAAPVPYPAAVAAMEARVAAILSAAAPEMIWLLEHPPIYTGGTSARPEELVAGHRFPVFATGRGGRYTYHGPGQRVIYVMLNVAHRGKDVRAFVAELEGWLIDALARFAVSGERRSGRVGIWVRRPGKHADCEEKIAAVGIRLRRWVSFHGLSLNVNPDLEHFSGIVPCGVREHGVTSLADLGVPASMREVDAALRATFEARFGATRLAPAA